MKTLLSLLCIFLLVIPGFAQDETSITTETMEVMPAQFMGVDYTPSSAPQMDLLKQYLRDNIVYPYYAVKFNKQGTEVVQFTVSKTGEVGNIEIVNSVCPAIDNEFVRVLASTNGKWKPALKNGAHEVCYKEVSLTFSLRDNSEETQEYFRDQATKHYLRGSEALLSDHQIGKAEKCFDRAINYKPNDGSLLYLRGICRYERGDVEGANQDWDRYATVTGHKIAPSEVTLNANEFKGVEAFANYIREK